jgi:hypothetical protein
MTNDQLTGKYTRLRNELEAAYAEPGCNLGRGGRIDRIANELVEIERTLAVQRVTARLIDMEEPFSARSQGGRLSLA